ncbi:unnamed protein product, partial [marine sediment metagenome]
DETVSLAKKEIKKRAPKIKKGELEKRALKIAIAAIFYGDLKNNRINNVVFDLKRFISFEGDTGPYVLYSYARASSILRNAIRRAESLSNREIKLVSEQAPIGYRATLSGISGGVKKKVKRKKAKKKAVKKKKAAKKKPAKKKTAKRKKKR